MGKNLWVMAHWWLDGQFGVAFGSLFKVADKKTRIKHHYFFALILGRFLSYGTTADLNIKSTANPDQTFIALTACPAYGDGYKKSVLATYGMSDWDLRSRARYTYSTPGRVPAKILLWARQLAMFL